MLLKVLVLKDDTYYKVRDNIQKCNLLIIDEISVLSEKDFKQLKMVSRVVKNNGKIFEAFKFWYIQRKPYV